MGNLGFYQTMTTFAKALGGPEKAVAVVGVVGYGVFRTIEAGGRRVYRVVVEKRSAANAAPDGLFTFAVAAEPGGGLMFHVGDQFRILERDGDAVLIEVLGDANNPYFVSSAVLKSVSDFSGEGFGAI